MLTENGLGLEFDIEDRALGRQKKAWVLIDLMSTLTNVLYVDMSTL